MPYMEMDFVGIVDRQREEEKMKNAIVNVKDAVNGKKMNVKDAVNAKSRWNLKRNIMKK